VSPLPEHMASHWWPRPGRRQGREQVHWHVLFHDQPQVQELAHEAQQRLAGLPGLDLVPAAWLHMTVLIVGFADEIESEPEALIGHGRKHLSAIAPTAVTFGRILYHPEAIMLGVRPDGALDPVLGAVQDATLAATGQYGVIEHQPWIPHVTVAYGNASQPAAPIIAALGRQMPPRDLTIRTVSLVAQRQVGHTWQWRSLVEIPLGPDGLVEEDALAHAPE